MSERLRGIRKQVANRKKAVAISRDDFDFMYRLASAAFEQSDVIYDLRATVNNQNAKIKNLTIEKEGKTGMAEAVLEAKKRIDKFREANARLTSRVQKAETRIGKILEAFRAIHNNSDGLLNFQGQTRDWRWLEQQGWLFHLRGGENGQSDKI